MLPHKDYFLAVLLVSTLVCLVHAEDDPPKKPAKLQIGIKHKPDVCERRATKGDLLHIHYRVSDSCDIVQVSSLNVPAH